MMTKCIFWVDYPFNPQDIMCGVLECDSLFQTCSEIIKIYNYGEKFVREAVNTAVSANKDIPREACMMPTSYMNTAQL